MTATAQEQAEALTPTIRQTVRRWRFWVIVLAVLAAAALLGAFLNGAGRVGTTFDPDSAAPAGGRALREVLGQQGVEVDVVVRLAQARSGSGTLLVDAADGVLTASAWRRLAESGRERIVVVSPDRLALDALLPAAREAGVPDRDAVDAACDLAVARRAGSMALEDVTRSLRADGADVCFTDSAGAGQLVSGRVGGTRVILLADRTAFTNEHIGRAGNAAVALTALGSAAGLTWYEPSPLDFGGRDTTLQDLTPAWVTPVAALLLLAGLAAALWRGRRLGPVVVESLPVAVRSRETVEGRARLYGRAHARLRAADALRIGAIGRLAPLLGLSRSASVEEVIGAAARTTGRNRDTLGALLLTTDPGSDRDLVRISDDLARLEAAVRAATVAGAAGPAPTRIPPTR